MAQPEFLTPFRGKPKFKQSQRDWSYLENIRFLDDQVEEVGWFDEFLMNYPNKMTASVLLHQRIENWFDEAGSGEKFDRRTRGIAYRHLIDL